MGHGAWGIGHGALGIEYWALRQAQESHGVLGMGAGSRGAGEQGAGEQGSGLTKLKWFVTVG